MSRERPAELPRTAVDEHREKFFQRREQSRRDELGRLKSFSGPGFMGGLMARLTYGRAKRMPQFLRRGYEAGIVDELNDFYARRPRPWRPAANAPKPNRKTLRSIGRRVMFKRQMRNRLEAAFRAEPGIRVTRL